MTTAVSFARVLMSILSSFSLPTLSDTNPEALHCMFQANFLHSVNPDVFRTISANEHFIVKCKQQHMRLWTTKLVISSMDIFVAIANNTWVKIIHFLLCQKSSGY